MATRLEMLEQFYHEDPNEPFNIYALALEYQKIDLKKAAMFFDILLTHHPQYVPTYYHAGKLFQDIGEKNKAIEIFERGITEARLVNDIKAARELKSALDELMFE